MYQCSEHDFTIFSHTFWKQTIDVQSRFTIYDFTFTLLLILIWKKNPLGILSVNWFEAGKYGVGGFSKILRNFQSGSWQMLTSNYKVGGWGEKRLKTCLRNIWMVPNVYAVNGILLPKLFWPTVRKNCSSDREKLLKFEAEGREFAKNLRSLEQFIQKVKGMKNV